MPMVLLSIIPFFSKKSKIFISFKAFYKQTKKPKEFCIDKFHFSSIIVFSKISVQCSSQEEIIGNRMKVPSDPVTVNGELSAKSHCESEKGRISGEPSARKPAVQGDR